MRAAFLGVTAEVNLNSLSLPKMTSAHKRGSARPYHARHMRRIEVKGGELRMGFCDERVSALFASSLLMRHHRMTSSNSLGSLSISTAIFIFGQVGGAEKLLEIVFFKQVLGNF
jgi:hypothetical protein